MRGRIQRKQNADKLRQLQALVRAHARAQAGILPVSEALHSRAKASRFSHHTVRAAHISFPSIEFGNKYSRRFENLDYVFVYYVSV